jgi:hypothetical protein
MEPSANEDTTVGMFSCHLENGDGKEYIFGCMKVVDGDAQYESSSKVCLSNKACGPRVTLVIIKLVT